MLNTNLEGTKLPGDVKLGAQTVGDTLVGEETEEKDTQVPSKSILDELFLTQMS